MEKNWFVAIMEFVISLLATGRPRLDAFLGMMLKICILITLVCFLLTAALDSLGVALPIVLEPLQSLIGSGAEAVGDALKGDEQGSINQVPAGLQTLHVNPDVPYSVTSNPQG